MITRNTPSLEGAELGRHLGRFCDEAEPQARLRVPELPPRCSSCAFREGPHLASTSPATQMDAMKCVLEGKEFFCHQHDRPDHLCSGWAMMMLAKGTPKFTTVPWDFSSGTDVKPDPDT
jgi:hypothetical protein